jgi:hypothetical protein
MKRTFGIALAALLLTGALLTGCSAVVNVGPTSDCAQFTDSREASVPIGGAKRVRIDQTIGDLKVTGRAGATELKATGKACATTQALVDRIQLKAEVEGDEVRLTADLPKVTVGNSPLINLTVEVPDSLPLVVEREVGSNEFRDVAALDLHKGVGTTLADGVTGDVTIDTGTGSTTVRNVKGNAEVRAGVGDMTMESVDGDVSVPKKGTGTAKIRTVGKNVNLADMGVGDLEIRQITGDVKLGDKGTGSVSIVDVSGKVFAQSIGVGTLEVRDVKGDLTIRSKGTGSTTYTNIGGAMDVPKNR